MTNEKIIQELDPEAIKSLDPDLIAGEYYEKTNPLVSYAVPKISKLYDDRENTTEGICLRARAMWISNFYNLGIDAVMDILKRTFAGVDKTDWDEFQYLKFEPSLEIVIWYYGPQMSSCQELCKFNFQAACLSA